MSKYFAKYLPVAEEIRQGDKIAFEGDMDDIQTFGVDVVPPVKYSDKKVKLFLCSNDIHVGDLVINNLGDIREWNKLDESFKGNRLRFKVIGGISQKAIWVRNGDEFEEEDILVCVAGNSGLIFEKDKADGLLSLPNFNELVLIKCPTCQTFH